jgi:tetratricopeptide (TPR) repeat protein
MRRFGLTASLLLASATAFPAVAHEQPGRSGEKLGTVNFPVSCTAPAQASFNRGVALLHSFWFDAAGKAFADTAATDPNCAMAHWGTAMNLLSNPLAASPSPKALADGWAAAETGLKLAKTEREKAWLEAIAAYYRDHDKRDHRTRVTSYEQAMQQLAARYPDDVEAQIYYALALNAALVPTDKTYANQLKAAKILEKQFAKLPDHPGIAHYLIHSYDFPPIAKQGLSAARRYASIAPAAPHALHMPSHIFTRLGYWADSVKTNAASAEIADRSVADRFPGKASVDAWHARDYMTYAYLQMGRDAEALQVVYAAKQPRNGFDSPHFAGPYGLAAMVSRYVLERERWDEAKALTLPDLGFDWAKYPQAETVVEFARGLGAARAGDVATATAAFDRLGQLHKTLTEEKNAYWANVAEINGRTVRAWTALARGHKDEALEQMRRAADQEDATEKHPVTPGPIVPARELLGAMLLQLGKPAEALQAYEKTLTVEPNRYHALSGAARAADAAGDKVKALARWREFAALTAKSDGSREQVRQARQKLAQQ